MNEEELKEIANPSLFPFFALLNTLQLEILESYQSEHRRK